MTKKHFEDLAAFIGEKYYDRDNLRYDLTENLSSWCLNQNDRFDEQRFEEAVEIAAEEKQAIEAKLFEERFFKLHPKIS